MTNRRDFIVGGVAAALGMNKHAFAQAPVERRPPATDPINPPQVTVGGWFPHLGDPNVVRGQDDVQPILIVGKYNFVALPVDPNTGSTDVSTVQNPVLQILVLSAAQTQQLIQKNGFEPVPPMPVPFDQSLAAQDEKVTIARLLDQSAAINAARIPYREASRVVRDVCINRDSGYGALASTIGIDIFRQADFFAKNNIGVPGLQYAGNVSAAASAYETSMYSDMLKGKTTSDQMVGRFDHERLKLNGTPLHPLPVGPRVLHQRGQPYPGV